jgi:RNA polymerase sigma factor (sigma-70 family)
MPVADIRNAKCGVATSFTTCLFTRFEPELRRLVRPESIRSLLFAMKLDPAIRTELLASAPTLRKFALSLCGTIDGAEDLVQETFFWAIANIDTFQPGTNLSAWLVTTLRNRFLSQYRKRRREVEDIEGYYAERLQRVSRANSAGRFCRLSRRAFQAACGAGTGVASGRRFGSLLRRGRGTMRLPRRHHQEPNSPRACATSRSARDRRPLEISVRTG